MCDRYVLPDQAAAEREFLPTRNWWNFAPKFNVVAASYVPTIRWHEGQSEAAMMRWGFIPSWAEGATLEPPPLDVNFDEVLNSPTFRSPWLNSQRCILLMAGFYVWQLTDARYRQPYYVRRRPNPARPFGQPYRFPVDKVVDWDTLEPGTDIHAVVRDEVASVTPLTWRMTADTDWKPPGDSRWSNRD